MGGQSGLSDPSQSPGDILHNPLAAIETSLVSTEPPVNAWTPTTDRQHTGKGEGIQHTMPPASPFLHDGLLFVPTTRTFRCSFTTQYTRFTHSRCLIHT